MNLHDIKSIRIIDGMDIIPECKSECFYCHNKIPYNQKTIEIEDRHIGSFTYLCSFDCAEKI